MNSNDDQKEIERTSPETDPEILKQWTAWRREEAEGLDIRQAVRRELEGSPLSQKQTSKQSDVVMFPTTRIILSLLVRLGAIAGWFFARI